ncbi:MAG: polysaccharide biosynthesis tyrosine autokinase [Pirellulales bacterium]|nr:polysaccharide biosynthesis tyrosine autokinase [Pirellulales bacterium]
MNKQSPKDNQLIPSVQGQPMEKSRSTRSRVPARFSPSGDRKTEISARFVLWVFHKWWKLVVPVGLLLAGIGGAVILYYHVPEYKASGWITIESTAPYIAFSSGGTDNSGRFIQTQIELLRSPIVLGNVISRPEISAIDELKKQSDPINCLMEKLSIAQVNQSDLYQVHYTSPSPMTARTVVNAVIAEYLDFQTDESYSRTQRVIDLLDEEHNRRSLELERLRNRILELAKNITGKDPFGHGAVTDVERSNSPAAMLAQNLVQLDVEQEISKAEIQAEYESQVMMPSQSESSGLLDLEIANHPQVQEREEAIADIELRMEEIRNVARRWSTNSDYIRLKNNRDKRKAELEETKAELREKLRENKKRERELQHQQYVADYKRKIAQIEARKEALTAQFNEVVKDLGESGTRSVEFEFAQAELAREEKVFEMIMLRKLALQTELRAPARVRLRQEADLPSTPINPIPYKLLTLSILASFTIPLTFVVMREIVTRRITDTEQLAQESKLRVLGEVARIPVRYVASETNTLPNRLRQEMYVFTESIDSLRTSLDLSEYLGSHNVIAITSASPAEGKTSVATSLAMSIANATNQSTLLIDGDLRKQNSYLFPNTESQPGLTEVLTGKASLRDAIHKINNSNTYLLPSGKTKVNPHRVVRTPRITQLLDELRPMFKCIVVDTPPVLSASEALVFAKAADAVIFCSLRDVSRSRQVCAAVERLEFAGANLLGAVLSGTTVKRYGYSYGVYPKKS